MMHKEMIAMLLAGGQGSRLGVLTSDVAKPAVAFGGKYRIIDFPLSNCINSGIDTVGVLTQYQPLALNQHIGIGIPWDLDRNDGGVSVLPPYERSDNSEWYSGTANAIYQNLQYIEGYDPDYVLILSGDHIYKMDYEAMLDFHKQNQADVTIAAIPVPMEEASRFGIVITDENKRITEFEEKPEHPRSNMASMGIYIFSWPALKEALIALKDQSNCDFGKHIIPYCHEKGERIYAFKILGMTWTLLCGNHFDFDQGLLGQFLHCKGGTGGAVTLEILAIHGIHLAKVAHVGEIAGGFHHIVEGAARLVEDGFEVFHALFGLCADAFRHFARGGVDGQLARNEDESVGFNSLAVRPDGSRSLCCCDSFFHC